MVAIPVRLIAGTTDACLKSLTPVREGGERSICAVNVMQCDDNKCIISRVSGLQGFVVVTITRTSFDI